MFQKFLKFLESHDRKRIVYDRIDNEPYLERYYLFLKDRGEKFPFNIFLHHFLKSDSDDIHDHPWNYITMVVRGGYWEWVPQFNDQGVKTCEIAKWRGAGHVRRCRANSFHRIELDPAVDCWTLFIPGRKQRDWGFLIKDQWVQWEQYLAERQSVK